MIELKSQREFQLIRSAGRIVKETIDILTRELKPGLTTEELEVKARDTIKSQGGIPAFKGYRGFPSNICASVNEVVVHGIPNTRKLEQGDIVSLDIGVELNGYFADAAVTLPVGRISKEAMRLLKVTKNALYAGIEKARPENRLHDISFAIQSYVEAEGYSVVRKFVGHGIGSYLHEEPEIPNFGTPGTGARLKPGMVLAIEPMVNAGDYQVEISSDGWTARTKDGKLSAHFEHTVGIAEEGPEILTS